MSEIVNDIWIDRITTEYLDYDKLEEVNLITGIDTQHEVNYVDLSEFDEHPELSKYVNPKRYMALQDKLVDYIVFRLDS